MFKKTLIAGAILAASTGLAFANGGTIPAPQPEHVGAFYLGAALSGDFGRFDATQSESIQTATNSEIVGPPGFKPTVLTEGVTGTTSVDWSGAGVNGDLFGGYGMTFWNKYYLGVEAFGSISNMDGDVNFNITSTSIQENSMSGFPEVVSNPSLSFRSRIELEHSYGIVATPGYKLTDAIMLYGRVGWIRSEFKVSQSAVNVNGVDLMSSIVGLHNFEESTNGLQLGVGFDMALTKNISLRAEYDYNNYKDITDEASKSVGGLLPVPFQGSTALVPATATRTSKLEIDPRVHQVKFGILYRFWGLMGNQYA